MNNFSTGTYTRILVALLLSVFVFAGCGDEGYMGDDKVRAPVAPSTDKIHKLRKLSATVVSDGDTLVAGDFVPVDVVFTPSKVTPGNTIAELHVVEDSTFSVQDSIVDPTLNSDNQVEHTYEVPLDTVEQAAETCVWAEDGSLVSNTVCDTYTVPAADEDSTISDPGNVDSGTDTDTADTSASVVEPTLPQAEPNYAVPSVNRTVLVSTEAELDSAFANIQPGDEIVLDSARVWSQIVLPNHGGDWATLRGQGDIPTQGTRISPSNNVTVVQHGSSGGIIRADGVSGWYIYGLKAETTADIHEGVAIHGSSRIVLDRMYVWSSGDPTQLSIRRGVTMNGSDIMVVNSRIEGIIQDGVQTQGIGVWNGAGPFLVENNFIEALNQNLLVGGATPSSLENNPSDGTVRNNHFYKRADWSGEIGTILHLEWKAGERWLVEGNVVENDYTGFSVGVKAPSETQGLSGQETSNLTLRQNKYIGDFTGHGAYFFHRFASTTAVSHAHTFMLEDELWETDVSGRTVRLFSAPDNMTIRRVTLGGTHTSLELVNEAPTGEIASLNVESYRARSGLYGLWLTDDEFPNGFQDGYEEHTFTDYWQYWNADGQNNCTRHASIPETLYQAAQDEFFCTQFESDIPSSVGANETLVNSATTGVRDSDLPQ